YHVAVRLPLRRIAHAHRHHRLQHEAFDVVAAGHQELAERTGYQREHHVVDGAPEAILDLFQILEAHAHELETSVRSDGTVERRERRALERRAAEREQA